MTPATKTPVEIKLVMSSVDAPESTKTRKYASLKGAHIAAIAWVGEDAQLSKKYAISADGVSKLTAEGVPLKTLFASLKAEPKEDVAEQAPCLCGCKGKPAGKKAVFLPGHDATLKGRLIREARGTELKSDGEISDEQRAYGEAKWAAYIK